MLVSLVNMISHLLQVMQYAKLVETNSLEQVEFLYSQGLLYDWICYCYYLVCLVPSCQ